MNFHWRGAGDSSPVESLNGTILSAVSLDKDTTILLHGNGLLSRHTKDGVNELSGIQGVVSVHQSITGDHVVLAVTSNGDIVRVDTGQDAVLDTVSVPPGAAPVTQVLTTDLHRCLVTRRGSMMVQGSPPCVGHTAMCDQWTQLRVSTGCELVSLVTGRDFTAAIVRRLQGQGVDTPDSDTAPSMTTSDVCPLGLTLTTQNTNSVTNQNTVYSLLTNQTAVSSVVSQVTSLGRTVLTNSMSLLSLTPQLSQDSGMVDASSNDQEAATVSLTMTKSSSEPPVEKVSSHRVRRVSEGGDTESNVSPLQPRHSGAELATDRVWCWGVGRRGQLGQGDMLDRMNPCEVLLPLVSGDTRIVKLSAGQHHCLGLTDTGQVWGWGDNTRGQASYTDTMAVVTTPHMVTLQPRELALDITCHGHVSAVLTQNFRCYVFGNISGNSHTRMQVVDMVADLSLSTHMVPSSLHMAASGCFVTVKARDDNLSNIVKEEIKILAKVSQVLYVMKQVTGGKHSSPNPLLSQVTSHLTSLRHELTSSCEVTRSAVSWTLTGLMTGLQPCLKTVTELCTAVCDCVASDQLMLDSHYQDIVPTIVTILTTHFNIPTSAIQGQTQLEQLLTQSVTQLLTSYLQCLQDIQTNLGHKAPVTVAKNISLLTKHCRQCGAEVDRSLATRQFWQTAGYKLQEMAKHSRRLVLDSRHAPVSVGSGFRSHQVILLSDCIIDSTSTSATMYHLATVWMELDNKADKVRLLLTTPEDSLVLSFTDIAARNVWHQALTRAIIATVSGGGEHGQAQVSAPVMRQAEYEWTRGEMRGNVYSGGWVQGKVHGKGIMKYNDGSQHSGQWRDGVRHGQGTHTGHDGRRASGHWERGVMTGLARIEETNGDVYTGQVMGGQPHGHGSKKEGKFLGAGASVYIGSWSHGHRHGYGVMELVMEGEKYLGMWSEGVRQGPGCVVNIDGVYYQGTFHNNKLTGTGLMLFSDGARYEGDFSGFGKFSGRGTLWSGNKKFVGTFSGNYSENMKFSGDILTINDDNQEEKDRLKDVSEILCAEDKWKDIFNGWTNNIAKDRNKVWENIAFEIGSKVENIADCLEVIPIYGQHPPLSLEDSDKVDNYLQEAFSFQHHPLSKLFNLLVEAYRLSYGGVKTSSDSTLLKCAVKELNSIVTRLYDILRQLFPALPASASQSTLTLTDGDRTKFVTPFSVLLPLFLPKIHSTIYILYAMKEAKSDEVYWERIEKWNRHPDKALLTFLDVDPKLFLSENNPVFSYRDRDKHFLSAINTLQLIKTVFTPEHKLSIILSMFRDITSSNTAMVWSMDALLPVCMYVVVRAKVSQLGAELTMLQDLMENHLFQGEQGIMLTTLLAAYHQILKESVFIN